MIEENTKTEDPATEIFEPGEAEAAIVRQGLLEDFETAVDGLDVDRDCAAFMFLYGASAFASAMRGKVDEMSENVRTRGGRYPDRAPDVWGAEDDS